MPRVSQKKVDLVDAVIPDKQKVFAFFLNTVPDVEERQRLFVSDGGGLAEAADLEMRQGH